MRIVFAVFVTLIFGMPVLADTVEYSDDPSGKCLKRLSEQGNEEKCAGLSAAACMNANAYGSTTAGMVECAGKEADFWDKELNDVYGQVVAKAKAADGQAKASELNVAPIVPALREMERVWIEYRDKTCSFQYALWQGGTGGGPASSSCNLNLTALQYIYLKNSLLLLDG